MSKSNADLVREALELYNREGFEALLPFAAPDIEIHATPGLLNAGDYTGREDAVRFNSEWEEAWGEIGYEPLELVELDARHVLAVVRGTLRGGRSGVPVNSVQYFLFGIEGGRFTRWHLYLDRDSAIAAAGDAGEH